MLDAEDHSSTVKSQPLFWPVVLAVWLSMFLYGCLAAPIPAVNEPHYLCKAKHFWQPDWCANDFFLASPNAHTVFYVSVGWLTRFLTFEQTAWLGRVAETLILAWGWTSLTSLLLRSRWSPLIACWLFLACAACGNLSGEWLVGGVEGKVFSYGLLMASLAMVLRERVLFAGILAGAALAFHPVVGVWGVTAFTGATLLNRGWWNGEAFRSRSLLKRWQSRILGLILMVAMSLPGMIPVIGLLLEPVPAGTKYAATYIQVYYRLAHHLDPMLFPLRAYVCYLALLLLCVILARGEKPSVEMSLFRRVVCWSVVFAVAGWIVGYGPRPAKLMPYFAERMHLLKFYPFRLVDIALPMAASIGVVRWLESRRAMRMEQSPESLIDSSVARNVGNVCLPNVVVELKTMIVCAVVFALSLGRAHVMVETNRYSGDLRSDWIDVCRWIADKLPDDALVQAPHNGWAFKWFAERAEYVSFKDCPQDARGIVEWNRRLSFLKKWYEDQYADQFYSAAELRSFRRETRITHLLTDRLGPLELEPIYRNDTFQIYDLTSLDE